MRTRQGQECVDLVQKGPHLRVAESGPDDNVTQRMTNKTAEMNTINLAHFVNSTLPFQCVGCDI